MSNRIRKNHKVYNIAYHIIWIPKYRKHILKYQIKNRLIYYLFEKASNIGISIDEYEIMPGHIHLFIKSNSTLSISFIVNQLKGYTSYSLRKEFLWLKKYKSLWSQLAINESTIHL